MKTISGAILLGCLAATPSLASDHIDGPITTKHGVADITDLYVFPTPRTPGSLTLILNAYPFAPKNAHFPERVRYNFFLRRANIDRSGAQPTFQTRDEVRISCAFETPHDPSKHAITCKSSSGLQAQSVVNDIVSAGDFKVFAGLRSDPFFFNARWAVKASTRGILLPPQKSNSMTSLNVLSIVIEVDISRLFASTELSLYAVAANTTTQDDANAPVRQLDRIGRPEITNVSMVANNATDLRDLYNREQPFKLSPDEADLYRARLKDNITFYDRINGKLEWEEAAKDTLVNLLLDDFLVVDIEKPSSPDDFFQIEKAVLNGKEHVSCGGRKITDDIMDTLFGYYINRGLESAVRDGVDKPAHAISDRFPYLAPPSTGLWTKAKSGFARWYFRE